MKSNYHTYFELETVYLTSLVALDYQDFYRLNTSGEVRKYLGGVPDRLRIESRFLNLLNSYSREMIYVVREKGTGSFCGLFTIDKYYNGIDYEISYEMLPDYWGKGIARQVLEFLIHHWFHYLGRKKLVAETQALNSRSTRLLEKAGMQPREMITRYGEVQLVYEIYNEQILTRLRSSHYNDI